MMVHALPVNGRPNARRLVIETAAEVEGLVPAWRDFAAAVGSPFNGPDWLMPWWRHYATGRPHLVTWWVGEELVGLAPVVHRVARRRGVVVREAAFWGATGTPLDGWVGVLALPAVADMVARDFGDWLARDAPAWDVFHYLRIPAGAPTAGWLEGRTGLRRLALTGVLQSEEYIVDLPTDGTEWQGYLGPKARHELRRAARRFAEMDRGRYEIVSDPAEADGLVDALRHFLADRWGEDEVYFRSGDRFARFLTDVIRTSFASGSGFAVAARVEPPATVGCLFVLSAGREAAAVIVGTSVDPALRQLSVGKALFHRAMDELVGRGVGTLDFLTLGGYKETFWGARSRTLQSGILGRGTVGASVLAYVALRRRGPRVLRRAVRALGHRGSAAASRHRG